MSRAVLASLRGPVAYDLPLEQNLLILTGQMETTSDHDSIRRGS